MYRIVDVAYCHDSRTPCLCVLDTPVSPAITDELTGMLSGGRLMRAKDTMY